MGPKKQQGGDKDIVIVPSAEDFDCELDEGCSDVASNDKKFEMNFDFREFARTDIKITITQKDIKIFAFSDTEFETNEFDEDIAIPKRVARDEIKCSYNKNGVLRITAPLQPSDKTEAVPGKTIQEKVTTTTTKVEGATKTTTIRKESEQQDIKQQDNKAISGVYEKDNEGNTIIPQAKKIKFEVDEKKVKDKPEFTPGSIKNKLEAYLKVAKYSPQDITVKVMKSNPRILRVEGRRESKLEMASFMKEIVLPENTKPENIEIGMNESGLLRITIDQTPPEPEPAAPPPPAPKVEEKKEVSEKKEKSEIRRHPNAVPIKPKKAKFDCTAEEIENSMKKEVSFKKITEKTMQVLVNVSEYTYEEVTITRIKRTIHVEAQREKSKKPATPAIEAAAKPAAKGQKEEVKKPPEPPQAEQPEVEKFHRQFEIPEQLDAENVNCEINDRGMLKFEANIFVQNMVKQLEASKDGAGKGKWMPLKAVIESESKDAAAAPSTPGPGSPAAKTLTLGPDGNYSATVPAQGYNEDEISITITPGWVTVKGKKQAKAFGSGFADQAFRTRSFSKKVLIPPQIVNLQSIFCALNSVSGALKITAPAK